MYIHSLFLAVGMIQVTCAIIIEKNRVLAAQRSEKMRLPLKWEFPGGKMYENETAEECILRELKEELSIDVKILDKLTNSVFDYGEFSINLIPFVVEHVNGNFHLVEHCNVKWFTKEELTQLDWAPADLPILNELLQSSYV